MLIRKQEKPEIIKGKDKTIMHFHFICNTSIFRRTSTVKRKDSKTKRLKRRERVVGIKAMMGASQKSQNEEDEDTFINAARDILLMIQNDRRYD